MTDKERLIQRIGEVQAEISAAEDSVRDAERKRDGAKTQRMLGLLGLLGGIILGIIGLSGDALFLVCGGVLLLAGILATVTQAAKVSGAEASIGAHRDALAELRAELARLQAELVA